MNVSTTRDMLTGNLQSSEQVMVNDVMAFDVSVYPDCPMARMVAVKITVGNEEKSTTIRSAAAMRVHAISDIGISGGVYVLDSSQTPQ